MSHFYGNMDGSARTTATRCGNKSSGLTAHLRSYHMGVKVELSNVNGIDKIEVYLTGGSNDENNLDLLASIEMLDTGLEAPIASILKGLNDDKKPIAF